MSKPTKEQIEAAKAFVQDAETNDQTITVRLFDPDDSATSNACQILLAALEEVEAKEARLRKVAKDLHGMAIVWAIWYQESPAYGGGEMHPHHRRVLDDAIKEGLLP